MDTASIDHETIARAIRANKGKLFADLRRDLRASLLAMSPTQALTLRLMAEDVEMRTISPGPNAKYAGAMISFCRGEKYEFCTVDSAVTPRVAAVVESTLIAFFSSEGIAKAIADSVLQELQKNSPTTNLVLAEISENQNWLGYELSTLANLNLSYSIAGQIIDTTAQQIDEFFKSAVGKQLMAAIAKMLATSSGKILIVKTLNVAIAKVMTSAALKTALLATIKKVGIGILIKTAVGKALIALLALVGIAHVPVVWIILPILAAFLVYEYFTFPEKLAGRIPDEVTAIVDSKFGELSDTVARGAVMSILDEVVKELVKVRTLQDPA